MSLHHHTGPWSAPTLTPAGWERRVVTACGRTTHVEHTTPVAANVTCQACQDSEKLS